MLIKFDREDGLGPVYLSSSGVLAVVRVMADVALVVYSGYQCMVSGDAESVTKILNDSLLPTPEPEPAPVAKGKSKVSDAAP